MNEKTEKIVFFGITFLSIIIFIYFENRYINNVKSKLKPLEVTYKDSLYLEISSIRYDGHVKVTIINGTLFWCGDYESFPYSTSLDEHFGNNYKNFKILSKKANNDTLLTIDRNRKVRYYNIRSGPCYDSIRDTNI